MNQLALEGMERAEQSANNSHYKWSDTAYSFLTDYAARCSSFMMEDVISASEGLVPEPPTKRAWGSIVRKAAKEGKVFNLGFQKKTSEGSHGTPAVLWGTNND